MGNGIMIAQIKKHVDFFRIDLVILSILVLCLYLDYKEGRHILADMFWLTAYGVYFLYRNYCWWKKKPIP